MFNNILTSREKNLTQTLDGKLITRDSDPTADPTTINGCISSASGVRLETGRDTGLLEYGQHRYNSKGDALSHNFLQVPDEFRQHLVILSDNNTQSVGLEATQLTSDPFKTGNKHFYNMLRPTLYQKKLNRYLQELEKRQHKYTKRQLKMLQTKLMMQIMQKALTSEDLRYLERD